MERNTWFRFRKSKTKPSVKVLTNFNGTENDEEREIMDQLAKKKVLTELKIASYLFWKTIRIDQTDQFRLILICKTHFN